MPHAVEFHLIAVEMAVDHCALDATEEVFLQHFLSLLGVAHIGDVLLVHGVEVATLDPGLLHAYSLHLSGDGLVGAHHEALGVGDA